MSSIAASRGKGWLKDLPDYRDNTPSTDELTPKQEARGVKETVNDILSRVNPKAKKGVRGGKPLKAVAVLSKVDLRQWCSPIDDQGSLGSCTAHAGTGLYEYFERRAFGKYVDASRLFLYKATRNLLGWTGDSGGYLRTMMGAMALFGLPPEKYWPYVESQYDNEPTAFLYSYAQNFQAILYYRLDGLGVTKPQLLDKIKESLRNGLPLVFGFTCYSSLNLADNGKIPFPDKKETVDGGHAVMTVGYDDNLKIVNPGNTSIVTTGAIMIRNSWGTGWGDGGYGWLPYEYILRGIADDWWSMTKAEWVDTQQFGEK